MQGCELRGHATGFMLGCLAGGCLFLLGAAGQSSAPSVAANRIGAFGDLRVTVEAAGSGNPDIVRFMTISRGAAPFLLMSENKSGEVTSFAILNGENGLVARGDFGSNGISEFGVFGNPRQGEGPAPVLFFQRAKTPGRWEGVFYVRTTPLGDKDYHMMLGEAYEDLDFDGQFDAKRIYNAKSEIVAQAIYLDGVWKEIFRVNDDGLFLKIGKYYADGTAFSTEGEQRTHYRFKPGVGWKIEKTDRASDGWHTDPADPVGKGQSFDDATLIRKEQKGMLTRLPKRK